MDPFAKTKVKLNETLNLLLCTKCSRLPEESVWMLSSCKHKYCEACFGDLEVDGDGEKAKKCVTCNQFSPNPCVPQPDLFSTKLLAELKTFKKYLGVCADENGDPAKDKENLIRSSYRKDDGCEFYPTDATSCDKDKNKTEQEVTMNADSREEETESILKLADAPSVVDPVTAGNNVNNVVTNVLTECEADDIEEDSDKMETNKSPPPRKFFKRPRAEKPKPQPQVNITPLIPIKPKKALPARVHEPLKGINKKDKEKVPVTPKIPLRPASTRSSTSSVTSSNTISVTHALSTTTPVVSSPASVNRRNAKGETPLHVAARTGKVERVKNLLELGADMNARDNASWTPLHEAVNGKSGYALEVVGLLLSSGCLVNVTGGSGETPLYEAAQIGNVEMVKLLLSYSATKDIPNEGGLVAANVAKTSEIKDLIAKFNGPYKRKLAAADVMSVSRLKESTSLLYFSCKVDGDLLKQLEESFKLKITTTFSADVTHVIFDSKPKSLVPLTIDYFRGILTGAWLLSLQWLTGSLSQKKLLDPDGFEIGGYVKNPRNPSDLPDASTEFPGGSSGAQKRARLNRERKDPGLFHGLCFYIYKSSGYHRDPLKLNKEQLRIIVKLGDGLVDSREPNPGAVDPLDNPIRHHARNPNHKLILTSHIILFGDGNVPPPAKKYNLEHVKTLRVDWLIQSVLNFGLCDPTPFLV